MDGTSTTHDVRNTEKMYHANLTKNYLRGHPKLAGKMMWRNTRKIRWEPVIGDK
jgi:hypothetical protein